KWVGVGRRQRVAVIERALEWEPARGLPTQERGPSPGRVKTAVGVCGSPEGHGRALPGAGKPREPKPAGPENRGAKNLKMAPLAPEIKLDNKSLAAPKVMDIAKVQAAKTRVPIATEPSLKLEEVGRRSVAIPQQPAINLDTRRTSERVADISGLPRTS